MSTSDLAAAARNYIAADPEVAALLGSSPQWGPWVFADKPETMIENTQQAMIVVTQNGSWAAANLHNTASFPRFIIDIWADPTRNPDNSVRIEDAKKKIGDVQIALKKILHTPNMNLQGRSIQWGTPEEIEERTGTRIHESHFITGPDFYPVRDGNGAFMGTYIYGASTD